MDVELRGLDACSQVATSDVGDHRAVVDAVAKRRKMNIPALLTESALQLDIGGHAPANHKWHAALCHLARDLHDERVTPSLAGCRQG